MLNSKGLMKNGKEGAFLIPFRLEEQTGSRLGGKGEERGLRSFLRKRGCEIKESDTLIFR